MQKQTAAIIITNEALNINEKNKLIPKRQKTEYLSITHIFVSY